MIRFAVLVALVACSGGGAIDEGKPLPPCQDCSPGAVRSGRIFSSPGSFVANRTGAIAGATEGAVVWLRGDFTVEASTAYDDDGRNGLAIDDAGGVAMSIDDSVPD